MADTTFTKFLRRGEEVDDIHTQVARLTGAEQRVWYQTTADVYLMQAYLARIGAAESDTCTHCHKHRETTGHFTNSCSHFHDTITKAHNQAWADIHPALQQVAHKEFQCLWDKPMAATGRTLQEVIIPNPDQTGEHLALSPAHFRTL